MNKQEHILTIIAEECNEVAQRATKMLRFGKYEIQEGHDLQNIARFQQELGDLLGAIEMLEEETGRCLIYSDIVEKARNAKKEKVNKYFEISRKEGALEE